MDWNLVGCARRGHVTYAPDEPGLRDRLVAPAAGGRRGGACAAARSWPAGRAAAARPRRRR
jgi:hypothetical protein